MSEFHTSVLLGEVTSELGIIPGRAYIDATVGGGGHMKAILRQGGRVLGIDRDSDALKFAHESIIHDFPNLKENMDWALHRGSFSNIARIAKQEGFENIRGIVFDLGISSHQLDSQDRGISYRFLDAPLDMRMHRGAGETAVQILNDSQETELYEIFAKYGEEQLAGPIARAVVIARRLKPIEKVGDLTKIVRQVAGSQKIEPILSRIFQSLRIVVNDEQEELKKGLSQAIDMLERGGRIAVISFHSLEDRIVKRMFKQGSLMIQTKQPIRPSHHEVGQNVRSRSAKLRVAQKI